MQIILEGPDNSGKSTLADLISTALGIEVHHSGGPSKYPGEINERTDMLNADDTTIIYDRHPAISQNIYQQGTMAGGEFVTAERIANFYALRPLLIYCRNVQGVEGHNLSEHSDAEWFERVSRHLPAISSLYDAWALDHAHITYRIGDDPGAVIDLISGALEDHGFNPWQDLIDFHQKFDLRYEGKPRQLPVELREFRENFLAEELQEYKDAARAANTELILGTGRRSLGDEVEFMYQLETQADSLVDLVYVALGNAYLQGFKFPAMWRRVHAANMKKVRANADGSNSVRKSNQDVVKPKGWEPPKHTDLIEDHAHREQFSVSRSSRDTPAGPFKGARHE